MAHHKKPTRAVRKTGRQIQRQRLQRLAQAATLLASLNHIQSHYMKTPYHTSPLSGIQWLDRMLDDSANPREVYDALGMRKHVFLGFVEMLETFGGLAASRHVSAREQVAIFLFLLRHKVGIRAIASRFNRSFDTVHT